MGVVCSPVVGEGNGTVGQLVELEGDDGAGATVVGPPLPLGRRVELPGRGTTFRIYLPRHAEAPAPRDIPSQGSYQAGQETIRSTQKPVGPRISSSSSVLHLGKNGAYSA